MQHRYNEKSSHILPNFFKSGLGFVPVTLGTMTVVIVFMSNQLFWVKSDFHHLVIRQHFSLSLVTRDWLLFHFKWLMKMTFIPVKTDLQTLTDELSTFPQCWTQIYNSIFFVVLFSYIYGQWLICLPGKMC